MTGASLATRLVFTIVHVGLAVLARPAQHTHADVGAHRVDARPEVQARAASHGAFVDVFVTVSPGIRIGALTFIIVDLVDTGRSIVTTVVLTVVDIGLAIPPSEPRSARTLVAVRSSPVAPPTVLAGRWLAWHVDVLTVLAGILLVTDTHETSVLVDTHSTVMANVGVLRTLVDVFQARHVPVACRTGALKTVHRWIACPAVTTRPGRTVVLVLAVTASVTSHTVTRILLQRAAHCASSLVLAWVIFTGTVLVNPFTNQTRVTERACTVCFGLVIFVTVDFTVSSIHTILIPARILFLTVLTHVLLATVAFAAATPIRGRYAWSVVLARIRVA